MLRLGNDVVVDEAFELFPKTVVIDVVKVEVKSDPVLVIRMAVTVVLRLNELLVGDRAGVNEAESFARMAMSTSPTTACTQNKDK